MLALAFGSRIGPLWKHCDHLISIKTLPVHIYPTAIDVHSLVTYSHCLNFFGWLTSYIDSKKEEKLQELQEKNSASETQLQNCEDRKKEISAELNKSKELLRNQDQLKRNIDDNLNYRKTKAEVEELTHQIESLEDEILSIGGVSGFEADLKRHLKEKERLLSEVINSHCPNFFGLTVDLLFMKR